MESDLHRTAKNLIVQSRTITLPAVTAKIDHMSRRAVLATLAPSRRYHIDSAQVEQTTGRITPDLLIHINGRALAIEITVTHGISAAKRTAYRTAGIPCVEIDLSGLARDIDHAVLTRIIIDTGEHTRWIYNGKAEKRRNTLLAQATFLPSVARGFATHADQCPRPARVWRGNRYANVIDDCVGCPYMFAICESGVLCDGFRKLSQLPPSDESLPRLHSAMFKGEDPIKALEIAIGFAPIEE